MSIFVWIFFIFGMVVMNVYSSEALSESDIPTWGNMLIQFLENSISIVLNAVMGDVGSIILAFMMVIVGVFALIIRSIIGDKFERSVDNFIHDVYQTHYYLNKYDKDNKCIYLQRFNKFIKKIRGDVIAIDSKWNRFKLQQILPSLNMLYDYMKIPESKKDYRSLVAKYYDWYKGYKNRNNE